MVIFIFLYGLFVKCEKAAETYLECLQPLVPAPPSRAGNEPSREIHNHGEGPHQVTRAFSCLKVPTSVFTFKTLLRYSAKQALEHGRQEIGMPHQKS